LTSNVLLDSLEIINNGTRLCVIPLDMMPYIDQTYTFTYPFSFYGNPCRYQFIVHPAQKDKMCEAVLNIVHGQIEDKQCILPQTKQALEHLYVKHKLQKGETIVPYSIARNIGVGFLVDILEETSLCDIQSIVLRLGNKVEKQLTLVPLTKTTLYASIDGNPFPFYGTKGIDFRNLPHFGRWSAIELKVTSVSNTWIQIRYIAANILAGRSGYVGTLFL